MTLPLRLIAALIVMGWSDPSSDYEAARERAGKGPDGLVRLALWCERHGLPDERVRNLALASAAARRREGARPARDGEARRALAGGVRGVRRCGPRRPDPVQRPSRGDQPSPGRGSLATGALVREARAQARARAHLAAVVQMEPSRQAAWHHLGYRLHKGRWMTPHEIDAAAADAKAQREADRHWGPELERLRTRIHQGGPAAQEAVAALADIRDPCRVRKLWEVFVIRSQKADDHLRAARVLAVIESRESTLRLVRVAVSSPSQPVADAALAAVENARSPRGYRDADRLPPHPGRDPGDPGTWGRHRRDPGRGAGVQPGAVLRHAPGVQPALRAQRGADGAALRRPGGSRHGDADPRRGRLRLGPPRRHGRGQPRPRDARAVQRVDPRLERADCRDTPEAHRPRRGPRPGTEGRPGRHGDAPESRSNGSSTTSRRAASRPARSCAASVPRWKPPSTSRSARPRRR